MTKRGLKPDFSKLSEKWPSSLVARQEISKFSGGILTPHTIANHDSLGTGPAGRVTIGRKVAYPVDSLIAWLESRATRVN